MTLPLISGLDRLLVLITITAIDLNFKLSNISMGPMNIGRETMEKIDVRTYLRIATTDFEMQLKSQMILRIK